MVGDDWNVSIKDKNVRIEGDCNVTIVGGGNIYCKKNVSIKSDGSAKIQALAGAEIDCPTNFPVSLKTKGMVFVEGAISVDTHGEVYSHHSAGILNKISADGFVIIEDGLGEVQPSQTQLEVDDLKISKMDAF